MTLLNASGVFDEWNPMCLTLICLPGHLQTIIHREVTARIGSTLKTVSSGMGNSPSVDGCNLTALQKKHRTFRKT